MIPKLIHITWKDNEIMTSKHIFPKHTIQKLVELSPDWNIQLSTDQDIDSYLSDYLDPADYQLLKDRHVVEKSDVWRLLKLYIEGGVYVDIDRLCNVSLNDIIQPQIKCILPTCLDYNFSQDFMCSAPLNPIFLSTLQLNLQRRREGHTSVYLLGPQTYMHGITHSLLGEIIDVDCGIEKFNLIRQAIDQTTFITTYREEPPYNTILFNSKEKLFDHEQQKRDYYASCGIRHWTNEW